MLNTSLMAQLPGSSPDIKMHLDNLLGGGNFGESVNNLLNVVGGYIWDQVRAIPSLNNALTHILVGERSALPPP